MCTCNIVIVLIISASIVNCLDLLEESPFLTKSMPWGPLSMLSSSCRSKSDDGPIMWVRPGEQLIPYS